MLQHMLMLMVMILILIYNWGWILQMEVDEMSNIVNLDDVREQRVDEQIDAMLDMEQEIRDSMLESVAKGFVDRMEGVYGVSPTMIIQDIMGSLVGRTIHEIQNGDEGGKEILAWMASIGQALCDDFEVDQSEEGREEYLDAMMAHRHQL